jgi:hypothetical protein
MKKVTAPIVLGLLLAANLSPLRTSAVEPEISQQQLKAQIQFFQEALDNLAPASPEQAAKLWAEGPKTRNGVLQYAAACDKLKVEIIRRLGKPEENFWNIGMSSPWVEKYEIGKFEMISPFEFKTTIKYYWATSTGASGITEDKLTIIKEGNTWCVSDRK